MEKLHEYLQSLLSSCSDELRLEPDKNPYLVAANNKTDVSQVPLMGTQISTMVFPLIPADAKAQLPHSNEVEFVHAHQVGTFSFTVQKSPAGFLVTIRPMLSDATAPVNEPAAEPQNAPYNAPYTEAAVEPTPAPQYNLEAEQPAPAFAYEVESSSASSVETSAEVVSTASATDLVVDESVSMPEYHSGGASDVEVVSVNDPAYQTVFSDAAADIPLRRKDDYISDEYRPPANSEFVQQPYQTPVQEAQRMEAPAFQAPAAYAPPSAAAFVPAAANSEAVAKMEMLFCKMADIGASDLHMSVSMPPMVRKDGKMQPLQEGDATLTPDVMRELLTSIMPARNQEEFAKRSDTDFAYEIEGLARFRCNIFADRKGMGAVFRIIPSKILTAEQLGLSKAIMDLCGLSKGLVVVTGPTGSGKSTTLCAMVDSINKTREDHIITIEDPIEFVHDNQKCLVNQREVHNHTDSFKDALRAALREDPDIVLVGEMRDLETISIAIETAETGHLVFGTLHTTTAASTVDRIIDQFPADRQQQIRVMLSESLKGVIAQTLLPKKGGGRVAALEVLIVTPAISNLIREGKTFQIPSAMQTGKAHGMVMLNDALFEHVQNGTVEPMDAYIKAVDKTNFETQLTKAGFKL